ncbi:L-idonate 5-dehydrogenase, partial [Pseudarthrobacter sp. CCNWLW217]
TLHINPVITHDYPVDQALEAFDVARKSAESGKVLLSFGGA